MTGARDEIRKVNPTARLSAAVYGWYPQCTESLGQDWGAWLASGAVDFVCPMNYTADPAQFRALARRVLAVPHGEGRIFPGIGVNQQRHQPGCDADD